jgi:hypothetical protein
MLLPRLGTLRNSLTLSPKFVKEMAAYAHAVHMSSSLLAVVAHVRCVFSVICIFS